MQFVCKNMAVGCNSSLKCTELGACQHVPIQIPFPGPSSSPIKSISAVNAKQISGDHYKKYGNLQPWDVVIAWQMGYLDGTALKYLARWRDKGGIDDLKKAIHFIEKLIETEQQNYPT